MKINVLQTIKDYEGKTIEVNKLDTKGNPVLDATSHPVMEPEKLRTYFINALNNTLPNEVLTAENKAQIYYLSTKMFRSKEVDFTESDREFIKDRVAKIYGPLIYGRICDILDGAKTTDKVPSGAPNPEDK